MSKRHKCIRCVNDGMEFSSMYECDRYYEFPHNAVSNAMRRANGNYRGMKFELIENDSIKPVRKKKDSSFDKRDKLKKELENMQKEAERAAMNCSYCKNEEEITLYSKAIYNSLVWSMNVR